MIILYLLLLIFATYGLLLILPKGNLLQEVGQLPIYLWKVRNHSLEGLRSSKIQFGPHRKQYFLFYESEHTQHSDKPIIIYYHGGGWTFGSPEQFAPNAKFFTDMGYPVIMPSYRRMPLYRSKAIADDLFLALRKTEHFISEKGKPNATFILGGLSAGANVAGLLALNKARLEEIGFDQSRIVGLMLHGAPLDLNAMHSTPLLYWYAGSKNSPSFNKANPVHYLNPSLTIPLLIIQGTLDGMVAFRNVASFVKKYHALGLDELTYHIIEEGTHLDAGRWAFEENQSAQWIKSWLSTLSAKEKYTNQKSAKVIKKSN